MAYEIGDLVNSYPKNEKNIESGRVKFVTKTSVIIFSSTHFESFGMFRDSLSVTNKDTIK